MSAPRPSQLRHRLSLQQVSRVSDEGGGVTESWSEIAWLWAGIVPGNGTEVVEAARISGRVSHVISLRYREGVSPAMRLVKGARIFEILAVIDLDEEKRWLNCLCEEREL